MLKLFRKLLGKSEAPALVPRVVAPAVPQAVPQVAPESAQAMPQVEVAHLSLAAILAKFPDDLKATVSKMPDPSATVALPIATIQKQLPTGSVKMSLASLFRQAPTGTFVNTRTEDRRMVDVPLSEIFRHVNPGLLPRRDQRRMDLPEDAVGLFGDSTNPYQMAPGAPQEAPAKAVSLPSARSVPAPQRPSIPPLAAPAPRGIPAPKSEPVAQRVVAPPPGFAAPAPASGPAPSAPAPAADGPPLQIKIADLAGAWPEPIRSEALAMEGTLVSLPTSAVTAGLAKGKVIFSWGQLRSWLSPAASTPTQGRDLTELLLPLKVVAPAFLSHSRPKTSRKTVAIDESIPALFNGNTPAPVEEPSAPIAPPAAEEAPAPAAPVMPEIPIAASIPSVIAPPAGFGRPETPAAPVPAPAPAPEPAPTPAAKLPEIALPAPALVPPTEEIPVPGLRAKKSIGEILGNSEKTHWSPPELVKETVKLPGVAGAVVALQEGLLVSAELPEEMKGDTVAAFLPQIFARLTNYAGEMKLGAVEDILFTTNGAHFKIFRLGEVYFAILGKPGESLPWDSLRAIAEELGQNHEK